MLFLPFVSSHYSTFLENSSLGTFCWILEIIQAFLHYACLWCTIAVHWHLLKCRQLSVTVSCQSQSAVSHSQLSVTVSCPSQSAVRHSQLSVTVSCQSQLQGDTSSVNVVQLHYSSTCWILVSFKTFHKLTINISTGTCEWTLQWNLGVSWIKKNQPFYTLKNLSTWRPEIQVFGLENLTKLLCDILCAFYCQNVTNSNNNTAVCKARNVNTKADQVDTGQQWVSWLLVQVSIKVALDCRESNF